MQPTPTLLAAALLAAAFASVPARAQAPDQNANAEGLRVFKQNCAGCHKWDGVGGGGYGGAALSLRATKLDKAQIVATVSCGRMGTGMPYHLRDAYSPEHPCYGIASRDKLGQLAPQEANNFLRPPEIAAVADYVVTVLKGKGPATLAECVAYWGDHSRVCDVFRTGKEKTSG